MITKDEMPFPKKNNKYIKKSIEKHAHVRVHIWIYGVKAAIFFFGNLNISEVCDFVQIARISCCINFQQSLNLRYIVHK